jgi:hypothetical protein
LNEGPLAAIAHSRFWHVASFRGTNAGGALKVATAEAYSGYKLYPWTHKQINVPHAYRRIKGLE